MAFKLDVGGGQLVTVNEPTRAMFSNNLGGAVEYSLAHFVYKLLEVMGGSLGSFTAGFLVQFLDRIEPDLVEYATPMIDLLLAQPNLPPEVKTFLTNIKTPKKAAGAAIINAFLGAGSGAVAGSILGSLLSPVTYGVNAKVRPARPTPAELFTMRWRGQIDDATFVDWLRDQGWPDPAIKGFGEILRPRADLGSLLEGVKRGLIPEDRMIAELTYRGFTPDDIALFKQLIPQLLNESQLFTAYFRGHISKEAVADRLRALGYKTSDIELVFKIAENKPPLPDIIRMAVREAWRDDVAEKWGYDQDYPEIVGNYVAQLGYNPDWAIRYWRAHWELPSVTLGIEMVHRGIISPDEFKELLRISDYPAGWRDRITQAVFTPFTRVDVRRMYKLGVLSFDDMVKAYRDLGYDDWHATKLAEFTQKYEAADPEDKPEKYKELTLSMLQKAYLKNLLSLDDFRRRILDLGYPEAEVDLIVNLTDLQRTVEQSPDFFKDYQRDVKAIVERSYANGMIDYDTASRYLKDVGITDEEIGYILSVADFVYTEQAREKQLKVIGDAYMSGAIDRIAAVEALGRLELPAKQQQKVLDDWDISIMLGARRLTEAQYRHAVIVGSISLEDYANGLKGQGYADKDIATLTDMLIEGLTGKEAIRLMRIGTLTESSYRGTLKRLGYTDDEINARLGTKS